MKTLLASLLIAAWLLALCAGAPLPSGRGSTRGRPTGKPPAWSISDTRARTPTPSDDPDVPLPGRSEVYVDHKNRIVHLFYGDDDLPVHMGHVQRNQAEFPSNKNPMKFASKAQKNKNRHNALDEVPEGGRYRNDLDDMVRDEKHLAMFDNPDHAHTTTVEMVPKSESAKEGGLASTLKIKMKKWKYRGQLRPNPGWNALDPHQRIGHEAPAGYHSGWQSTRPPSGQRRPDYQRSTAKPRPAAPAGTNLRPGYVSPAGHVWSPNTAAASHHGAPAPLKNSDTRHPPRPKDQTHYELQQKQAAEAHMAHEQAQKSAEQRWKHVQKEVHTTKTLTSTEKSKYHENLAKFNAAHPIHPIAHGGRPAEAPGRLGHKDDHQSAPHSPHHASAPQVGASHQHGPPPPHAAAASSSSHTAHSTNARGIKRLGSHTSSGEAQKKGRHMQ